ncbi:MAG: flippase-like domain-containing protein [Candidatus Hydrogenedentes bacterium]|nr:flippase-like domain-containing protein [Candidatus Hydrogenedentota bacterium]
MSILTRRSATALLWVVGLGVYLVVVVVVGWRPIADSFASARPGPVAAMAGVTLAALWIRVLKWRVVLGREADAVPLFWLSKAAGEWSPGRIGELSPLLLQRYRTPRVAAWLVLDRILEMVTTIALGIAGFLLVRAPNRTAMLAAALLVLAAITAALFVLAQRRIFEYAASRFASESRLARALHFAADTSDDIKRFRSALVTATVLTVLPGLMDVWAGMLLYQAFDAPVSFALMAAVKGLHAITSAIPITPNATGIPYLTAAVLLHEVGRVPSDTLAAAIALAVALTNVIFWLSASAAARLLWHKR